MFTMEDLKPFFDNATMEIDGITFRLTKEEEMAGEMAVWHSEKYKILATPYFEGMSVAIEVMGIDVNGDCNVIDGTGIMEKLTL